MKDNNNKEKIVKTIREALMEKKTIEQPPVADEANTMADVDLTVAFAKQYTRRGGTMYYCSNEEEIVSQLQQIQSKTGDAVWGCCSENLTTFITHLGLKNACTANGDTDYQVGAMLCDGLIASDGGIVLTSKQGLGESFRSLAKTTIVVAFTSQVVADNDAAMVRLKEMYKVFPTEIAVLEPRRASERETDLHLVLVDDE